MARRRYNPLYLRFVQRPLEAAFIRLAIAFLRLLPLDWASALGGCIGRGIGSRLPVNWRTRANLRLAFPGISETEMRRTTRRMWDNLGRTFAEFPHLEEIVAEASDRVEIVNSHFALMLKKPALPGIFVSGHFANWEVMAAATGRRLALELNTVMREPNNPLLRPVLNRLRAVIGGQLVPKGPAGAGQLITALRNDGLVAVLIDQKLNDGIPVPFFGSAAMTAAAPARLALRFRCPLVPVHLERLGGARFRLTFHPALPLPDSGDRTADILELTRAINALLEDWIRERPEQWFWLHRRWPEEAYAERLKSVS